MPKIDLRTTASSAIATWFVGLVLFCLIGPAALDALAWFLTLFH